MAVVRLSEVRKVYPGGVVALVGLTLTIDEGESFVVVGPSGSGKTTLLRLIAGLESLSGGGIWIGGRRVDALAPRQRDVALVFQNPALYPHLSVFENLAFGLRARRFAASEVRSRVEETAEALGLSHLLGRSPRALSGGQQRRVALGRALARRPSLLLLDEALSDLDAPLRLALRAVLKDWQRRFGGTVVAVTHDQTEAMALGQRLLVLRDGASVQVGSPSSLYDEPAHRFVAEFLGHPPINVLPCAVTVEGEGCRLACASLDEATFHRSSAWVEPVVARGGGPFELGIRPEHVHLADGSLQPSSDHWMVASEVRLVEHAGPELLTTWTVGPVTLHARLPRSAALREGQTCRLALDLSRALWFDPKTGRRITGHREREREAPAEPGAPRGSAETSPSQSP